MEISCLIKNVDKIDEIFNNEYFNSNDFDKFIEIINNKKHINTFTLFLNGLNKIIKNNTKLTPYTIKCFLSIYTFIYYPTIMNLNPQLKINKDIINMSNILNILFKNILKCFKQDKSLELTLKQNELVSFFFIKFNNYLQLFQEWKLIDIEAIFFNLAISIFDMEQEFNQLINDKTDPEILKLTQTEITNETEHMYERALTIDNTNGKNKVINYYNFIKYKHNEKKDTDTLLETLSLQLEKSIKKAYWDILESDLSETPPKIDNLIIKLTELKHLIKICIPNRPDIHTEIDTNLDIEFIKHKINSEIFDYEELLKYTKYIFDKLKQLQSRDEDQSTKEFEQTINIMIEEELPIATILKHFLKYVFQKFENIYIHKNQFMQNIQNN